MKRRPVQQSTVRPLQRSQAARRSHGLSKRRLALDGFVAAITSILVAFGNFEARVHGCTCRERRMYDILGNRKHSRIHGHLRQFKL